MGKICVIDYVGRKSETETFDVQRFNNDIIMRVKGSSKNCNMKRYLFQMYKFPFLNIHQNS